MKLSCTFGSVSIELLLSLHCRCTHPEAARIGTFCVDWFLDTICGPGLTWFLLQNHPGSLLSRYTSWPHSSVFRFVGLGKGPGFCVFKNSLGDSFVQLGLVPTDFALLTLDNEPLSLFIYLLTHFLSHSTNSISCLCGGLNLF